MVGSVGGSAGGFGGSTLTALWISGPRLDSISRARAWVTCARASALLMASVPRFLSRQVVGQAQGGLGPFLRRGPLPAAAGRGPAGRHLQPPDLHLHHLLGGPCR